MWHEGNKYYRAKDYEQAHKWYKQAAAGNSDASTSWDTSKGMARLTLPGELSLCHPG